jgi:hypothetical protein
MKTRIKKGLAYRRIAGDLFIVDSQRAELHELNGPAALIWEGLAAGKTEAPIVSAIAAEFEVSEKEARADVKDFLEKLAEAGLVAAKQGD